MRKRLWLAAAILVLVGIMAGRPRPRCYRLKKLRSRRVGGEAYRPGLGAAWSCPGTWSTARAGPGGPHSTAPYTRVRIPYPSQRLISESSIAVRVWEVANVSAGLVPAGR